LASSEKKKAKEKPKDQKKETNLAASAFKMSEGNKIIADSGANVHLTGNIEWFSSLRKLATPLILNVADGKTLQATHVGIDVEKSNNGKK